MASQLDRWLWQVTAGRGSPLAGELEFAVAAAGWLLMLAMGARLRGGSERLWLACLLSVGATLSLLPAAGSGLCGGAGALVRAGLLCAAVGSWLQSNANGAVAKAAACWLGLGIGFSCLRPGGEGPWAVLGQDASASALVAAVAVWVVSLATTRFPSAGCSAVPSRVRAVEVGATGVLLGGYLWLPRHAFVVCAEVAWPAWILAAGLGSTLARVLPGSRSAVAELGLFLLLATVCLQQDASWRSAPLLLAAFGCGWSLMRALQQNALAGLAAAAGAWIALLALAGQGLETAGSVAGLSLVVWGLLQGARGVLGIAAGAIGLALTVLGFAGFNWGTTSSASSAGFRLTRQGVSEVRYQPASQGLSLHLAGRLWDVAGPDDVHAALVAGLCHGLLPEGARIVAVDGGSAPIREAMQVCGRSPEIEAWPSGLPAAHLERMGAAGPLVSAGERNAPGPTSTLHAGALEVVGLLRPTVADAVVVAAPLLDVRSWLARSDAQRRLRIAVGDGLALVPFSLRHTSASLLASVLDAMAHAHPRVDVFLAGGAGVLVGSGRLPSWDDVERRFTAADSETRWLVARCGIGNGADLRLAWLGRLTSRDDKMQVPTDAPADLSWLAECLTQHEGGDSLTRSRLDLISGDPGRRVRGLRDLTGQLWRHPDSLLLWRECRRGRTEMARDRVLTARADDPRAAAAVAELAAGLLHEGAHDAVLQAALGLPNRAGERYRSPVAAAACSLAIDPTLWRDAPPVLREILQEPPAHAPLADFAALPQGDRLIRLCEGYGPLAVALRSRFGLQCAKALAEALARGELSADGRSALRELVDPFVLQELLEALAERGDGMGFLAVFRSDLPMPRAARRLWLATSEPDRRARIQASLAGRRDANSLAVIAEGLIDPDPRVREASGAALFRSVDGTIAYDPLWPEDRRRGAAAELRDRLLQTP